MNGGAKFAQDGKLLVSELHAGNGHENNIKQ